jgi:hypothetical protein
MVKEYETAIGQALVAGKKPPENPIPAYDLEIEDLLHRAEGAGAAAALSFGEIGEQVIAQQQTAIEATSHDLSRAVETAIDAAEALRPLLGDVIAINDRRRWLLSVTPGSAGHYGSTSGEQSQIDRGVGDVLSVLRTLRNQLAELGERAEARVAREVAVEEVS